MSGYMQNKFAISDFADFTLSAHDSISGSVQRPISSTDNAVARFNGVTGKTIQNSGVIISDSNNITGVSEMNTIYISN